MLRCLTRRATAGMSSRPHFVVYLLAQASTGGLGRRSFNDRARAWQIVRVTRMPLLFRRMHILVQGRVLVGFQFRQSHDVIGAEVQTGAILPAC